MKQRVRLTEGDLRRIVKESVNRILCEMNVKDSAYADEENEFMENPIERPQRRSRGKQLYTIYEVRIDERHPEEHNPWRMIECDATFDDVTAIELEVNPYCGNGTDEEGNYWFETLYDSEIPYMKRRFVAVKDEY